MDFMKKVNEVTGKVGEIAVGTYKTVAQKSNTLVQETKTKLVINEKTDEIEGIYKEMGQTIYRSYKRGEDVGDLAANCKMLEKLEKETKELQDSILEIKNQRRCDNCNAVVPNETSYCPSCGYGVEDEKEKTKAKAEKKPKAEKKVETTSEVKNEEKKPKVAKIPIKKPEVKKEEVKKVEPKKAEAKKVEAKKAESKKVAKKVEPKKAEAKKTESKK